jgi:hypothetical protein
LRSTHRSVREVEAMRRAADLLPKSNSRRHSGARDI